jgi:hypothetical protein
MMREGKKNQKQFPLYCLIPHPHNKRQCVLKENLGCHVCSYGAKKELKVHLTSPTVEFYKRE